MWQCGWWRLFNQECHIRWWKNCVSGFSLCLWTK